MSVWTTYENRIKTRGKTTREAVLKREQDMLRNKLPDNLSYISLLIDGINQQLAVINSDDMSVKYLHSLPNEDIMHGGLVFFEDSYWLVTERDAKNEVYTSAKMERCNHLLKWITDDGVLHEQWCIVEDGTKYLTGELEDRNFVVTRGDTRIALIISRNKLTASFSRDNRFLIDDEESEIKLSYQLTKPFKLTSVFNGTGVYKFILQEVASTDDDNHELGVADYYKYFPRESSDSIIPDNTPPDEDSGNEIPAEPNEGKKVWI